MEIGAHSKDEERMKLSMSMAEMLDLKREQIAAIMTVGCSLYEQGFLKQAIEIFETLTVLDPFNSYVNAILDSIYQKQEEYETALKRYNKALALFPYDTNALTKRGEILFKLGRYQEAVEDFRLTIQLDPQRRDPATNRALMLVNIVRNALALTKREGID